MDNILYVGVDLHKTQFTICVLCNGSYHHEGLRFDADSEGYRHFIELLRSLCNNAEAQKARLAIESTGNSRHFKTTLEEAGFEVVVVNTLRFKVVNQSTKKTDKNDARTLVDFLAKDMLPQSHLCSAHNEAIRRVLKSRSLLVQNSVALKNQAHAVLLAYGIQTKVAQFQSRKERMEYLAKIPSSLASVLSPLFNTLDTLELQRKNLEKDLSKLTKNDIYVSLLMTIPGIGIVNACTISSYIDDISRFPSYKHFSAYCGLVPWVQSSNESVYYGKITKHGPPELRTALVQCVVAMVRMTAKTKDYSLMKQYQTLKEDKSSGKAIIAIARRLSRIIYIMLSTGQPFNEKKALQ